MVRCPMLHAMRKVPEVKQLNMRVSYMLNVTKYDYSSSEPYGHVHVFHWADDLRNKAEVEVQRLSQQFLRAGWHLQTMRDENTDDFFYRHPVFLESCHLF